MENSMKDFLFFNYSWVPNSTLYFQSFIDAGYDCDIVTELNLGSWQPTCKYRAVVVYLHEPNQLPIINYWLDQSEFLKDSFLIQHDTTDFQDVQHWTNRKPDLVMQRELFDGSQNPRGATVEPFHFPIPSMYDSSYEQNNDVMFYGCMTNEIRRPFTEKILELSQGSLSHLKWDIKVTGNGQRTPEEYRRAINQCKIGLHYFGNSRDSIRIWEIAGTKAAIIMPKLRMTSVSEGYMPFNEYVAIEDDFSDLEEKILYTLEDDRWKNIGEQSFEAFEKRHSPKHCFKYYHNVVERHMEQSRI
tara:strand:+ start:8732 stop:9634 length:903 start_codon:yes stop_codon:yes gene_type:complete